MRRTMWRCPVVWSLLLGAGELSAQQQRLVSVGLELSMPISADASTSGFVALADMSAPAVHLWSASGSRVATVSRQGRGPGDVLRPYRVAIGKERLFVYDFAVGDVSLFDLLGRPVSRARPVIPFQTIDDLVALGDSAYALLGVSRVDDVASRAIHVFATDGRHLRSFAAIAEARDRSKLAVSGTGTLALTERGTLLYVRKGPYELLEYSPGGQLLRKVPVPEPIGPIADSLVRIEVNSEGQERTGMRVREVRAPVRAVPLAAGMLLSGILDRGTRRWWLHDAAGRARPVTLPDSFSPTVWNSRRCELLGFSEMNDEPALVALPASQFGESAKELSSRCK